MNLRVLEQRLNKIQEESTTHIKSDDNKDDEEEEEEGEVEDDLETGDLSDDPSTLPEDEPNFVPNQVNFGCNRKWAREYVFGCLES